MIIALDTTAAALPVVNGGASALGRVVGRTRMGPIMRTVVEIPSEPGFYQAAVDLLTLANLAEPPPKAALLSGGVRYAQEPYDQEIWQTRPVLDTRGLGDCEDLAAAYAAELIRAGTTARAVVVPEGMGPHGGRLFHVVTATKAGLFDPSKELGM